MTHPYHQTKFRWTENLTSRFIQLRKENGNLFTGRKYSAQAGWEHILQQMRREFPTIMADVHYRVLKKKWSNLLQQYKELKNPVHGDKNKSDDVSWPFYGAIDEVLGYVQRNDDENDNENENENENENDEDLNPHEFLCLSVTPEDPASPDEDQRLLTDNNSDVDDHHKPSSIAALQRIPYLHEDFSIEIERLPRVPIRRPRISNNRASQISQELRRRDVSEVLVSRLPPATELSIKTIRTSGSSVTSGSGGLRVRSFANNVGNSSRQFLRDTLAAEKRRNGNHSVVCNYNTKLVSGEADDEDIEEEEEEEEDPDDEDTGRPPPRKLRRSEAPSFHGHECNLERRLNEFLEYTKKRDEENRLIMTRILNAVETIAEKQ